MDEIFGAVDMPQIEDIDIVAKATRESDEVEELQVVHMLKV